jgi:septal ring factor EnvC (AmiA/AmiB activator)
MGAEERVMALPLDPAWIALIGTVIATVGLKVTEHWLNRNKSSNDDAKQIRDELRTQVVTQKEEIERLEAEVEAWRTKYYDLRDQFMKQNTELTLALDRLKATAKTFDETPPV